VYPAATPLYDDARKFYMTYLSHGDPTLDSGSVFDHDLDIPRRRVESNQIHGMFDELVQRL
jgi:hypothetical protein